MWSRSCLSPPSSFGCTTWSSGSVRGTTRALPQANGSLRAQLPARRPALPSTPSRLSRRGWPSLGPGSMRGSATASSAPRGRKGCARSTRDFRPHSQASSPSPPSTSPSSTRSRSGLRATAAENRTCSLSSAAGPSRRRSLSSPPTLSRWRRRACRRRACPATRRGITASPTAYARRTQTARVAAYARSTAASCQTCSRRCPRSRSRTSSSRRAKRRCSRGSTTSGEQSRASRGARACRLAPGCVG
mmetsp:Transcript_50105/g.165917  ORF Transcript_50105/g.165917 Transcript_50105/m.165917 type:complete len:246 (-) Transcript_50105:1238-1975(-)